MFNFFAKLLTLFVGKPAKCCDATTPATFSVVYVALPYFTYDFPQQLPVNFKQPVRIWWDCQTEPFETDGANLVQSWQDLGPVTYADLMA